MKVLTLALAGTALLVSACNRSDEQAANNNDALVIENTAPDNAADPAAVAGSAQGFANAAAASDMFEIESSKLAQTAGESAAVKSFAAEMIKGHTASSEKLKATTAKLDPPLTPAPALNPEQQALLDGLKGKTGAEFDRAYAEAQVTAHTKTLALLNEYAGSGDSPPLVELAKGMIPVVTAHLNQANALPK